MRLATKKKSNKKPRKAETSKVLLTKLFKLRAKVNKLPKLSAVERVAFDHNVDIHHLYNSSKVEGTILTSQQIQNAIHDRKE